jgi:hypothetical protein
VSILTNNSNNSLPLVGLDFLLVMDKEMSGLLKPCTEQHFVNNIMNKPTENNHPLIKIANSGTNTGRGTTSPHPPLSGSPWKQQANTAH